MAVSASSRRLVRERAQLRCEYCHADERWQFIRFTIDHILPQSAGGSDDPGNLALACRNCNERRGNRSEGRDPQTGQVVPIFNPRLEAWIEHFAWAATGIRIVGRTSTGWATIELLDLNDDRHNGVVLRTRQRDVSDGYHPPSKDTILAE
jgi:hypothetical protein